MVVFNFGPQHPSTHGVLSLIIMLFGEIINWLIIEIGLLHSGTEKLIDSIYFNCSISYFDSLDYVSTIIQELLYIYIIESLLNLISYIYILLLKSLFIEYYSILNHILAITTHIIDIGLFTTMLWLFEESEKLINIIELLSGNRLHVMLFLIISLSYDLTINLMIFMIWLLMLFIKKLKEIIYLLSKNFIWIISLLDVVIINLAYCIYYGLSGIISSSCYIMLDYSLLVLFIEYLMFGFNNDSLDSFNLRIIEIIMSCSNIYLLLLLIANLIIIIFSIYSYILIIYMELLINYYFIIYPFIISINLFMLFYIESSKGIYSILINCFPYWITYIITNDLIVLNQLNKFCSCINLADMMVLLGSIDFVLGSMDLSIIMILYFYLWIFPIIFP